VKRHRGPLRKRQSHLWVRDKHDFYVEPEWVSRRLFEVESFGAVWDPACGSGRIVTISPASRSDCDRHRHRQTQQRPRGSLYLCGFDTSVRKSLGIYGFSDSATINGGNSPACSYLKLGHSAILSALGPRCRQVILHCERKGTLRCTRRSPWATGRPTTRGLSGTPAGSAAVGLRSTGYSAIPNLLPVTHRRYAHVLGDGWRESAQHWSFV
jgi:hypothetical protein